MKTHRSLMKKILTLFDQCHTISKGNTSRTQSITICFVVGTVWIPKPIFIPTNVFIISCEKTSKVKKFDFLTPLRSFKFFFYETAKCLWQNAYWIPGSVVVEILPSRYCSEVLLKSFTLHHSDKLFYNKTCKFLV